MRVFLSLFFVFCFAKADSCEFVKNNSLEKLKCENISVSSLSEPTGLIFHELVLEDGFQLTLEVLKTSRSQRNSAFLISGSRSKNVLSAQDKKQIQTLAKYINENSTFSDSRFIRFFNSLPVNEDLNQISQASLRKPLRFLENNYTSICHSIGFERMGFFTLDPNFVQRGITAIVGEKESQCYGRCGSGCDDDSPVYTQECFDHDICHRSQGQNFGVCSDEWWAASDGYVFAPECHI